MKRIFCFLILIFITTSLSAQKRFNATALWGEIISTVADTTELIAYSVRDSADVVDNGEIVFVFMRELASGVGYQSGGIMMLHDSSFYENGVASFNSTISGKQWTRHDFIYGQDISIEWAGAKISRADNATYIQKCIGLADSHYHAVYVPSLGGTNVFLSGQIILNRSTWLRGNTSRTNRSELKAIDGLNDDFIIGQTTDWHHGLKIESLRVNGNKANQTSGNGIYIIRMGENSIISDVYVSTCYENGILIDSLSAPSQLHNISAMNNGGAGVRYINKGTSTSGTILHLSGDLNGTALLDVELGAETHLAVMGIKSEDNPNVVIIRGTGNPVDNAFTGGLSINGISAEGTGTAVFQFLADHGISPGLTVLGSSWIAGGYTYFYTDSANADTMSRTTSRFPTGIFTHNTNYNHLEELTVVTAPIVVTTGTYTVLALNSGRTHVIPDLAGNTSINLPTEKDGLNYEFIYVGGAADTHDHTIDSGANANFFIGGVSFLDIDAGAVADEVHVGIYSDGGSNSKLTINNMAAGTLIEIVCNGTNWYVTGQIMSDTVPAFADQ